MWGGGVGGGRCSVNEDQHFRGVCVGRGGGRCSVNEDQHFRGVCVWGGGGGGGQVFCKRRPTL